MTGQSGSDPWLWSVFEGGMPLRFLDYDGGNCWQRWSMGNRDGKEDFEAASMDERGYSYAENSAREKAKTTVIARKLKRTVGATHQKAMRLGVALGGGRIKRA